MKIKPSRDFFFDTSTSTPYYFLGYVVPSLDEKGRIKKEQQILSNTENFTLNENYNINSFEPVLTFKKEIVEKVKTASLNANPKLIFYKIIELLKYYYEFQNEQEYYVLATYTFLTYFKPLFNSVPYLFLNAVKGSGKTKLLTLLSYLVFNPVFSCSISSSALFRVIHNTDATLLLDEMERISDKELQELRTLLLQGYKKGAFVWRTEKGVDKFKVQNFDVFGCKILSAQKIFDDTLFDRCIFVNLEKSSNVEVINREVSDGEEFENLRIELLGLYCNEDFLRKIFLLNEHVSFGNLTFRQVFESFDYDLVVEKDVFDLLRVYFVEKNEGLGFVDFSLKEFKFVEGVLDKKVFEVIKGRDWELWKPLLVLGLAVDKKIFLNLLGFAVNDVLNRRSEDLSSNLHILILKNLFGFAQKTGWYVLNDFKNFLSVVEENELVRKVTNRTLMKFLKTLGFDRKKLVNGKTEFFVNRNKLEELIKKYGVVEGLVVVDFSDNNNLDNNKFVDVEGLFLSEAPESFDYDFLIVFSKKHNIDLEKVEELVERLKMKGDVGWYGSVFKKYKKGVGQNE